MYLCLKNGFSNPTVIYKMVDVEPFVKPQFQDLKKMCLTFCFLLNKMEFDNDQNK